ncbi:MAG: DUF362 domain-containing protein [Nitrospiraceae bacterium]|nr:MAG: DUF362 domain-containing protein [Nitrospiraceae bacterium]
MIIKRQADTIRESSYGVAAELLASFPVGKPVLIKPNIVEPSPPPVTTDVRVVAGIVSALKDRGISDIIIAEGSGTGDTMDNFRSLGYASLGVKLVDLDREETVTLPVKHFRVWQEITVPAILLSRFIISVPALKEHSLCGVTVSLKNMVGVLPARLYSGYWSYKKSQIHKYDTHGCIADLVSIVPPAMSIVDASVGLKEHHLSGSPADPALNMIYGSPDALEADIFGCGLIGRKWKDITYLRMVAEDKKRG